MSAPADPAPDQPGGGVWARGVGGQANITSTSNSVGVSTQGGAVINTATTNCNNQQRQTFAGAQVGTDIARLNYAGWNLHLGTTAGYLSSRTTDNAGFGNDFEVPFWGTYFVATKGRFFADLMVRQEFYNINLNNPTLAFSNQPVGAHGWSISASTGYNFDLGQGWFIEPSAGFIYSRTSVDSFTAPGVAGANFTGITGVVQTNDVTSQIGRASLRVGKAIATPTVIWQPFASASVFHEFAGDVRSNYTSLNASVLGGGALHVQPGNDDLPRRHLWPVFARPRRADREHRLARLRARRLSQRRPHRRLDRQRRHSLPVHARDACCRHADQGSQVADPGHRGNELDRLLCRRILRRRRQAAPTSRSRARRQATNRPWVFGPIGGIQLGYNYQFANNWVLGFEGDIGAADVHGGRSAGTQWPRSRHDLGLLSACRTRPPGWPRRRPASAMPWAARCSTARAAPRSKTAACLRPASIRKVRRCSLLLPNLCFNQAGVVFANGTGFGTSSTRVGWTIGYGTEFDLGKNWSAKAEYDYISFGSHTALASDGTTTIRDRADISQVKVGLNYRFGPTAVVAKY